MKRFYFPTTMRFKTIMNKKLFILLFIITLNNCIQRKSNETSNIQGATQISSADPINSILSKLQPNPVQVEGVPGLVYEYYPRLSLAEESLQDKVRVFQSNEPADLFVLPIDVLAALAKSLSIEELSLLGQKITFVMLRSVDKNLNKDPEFQKLKNQPIMAFIKASRTLLEHRIQKAILAEAIWNDDFVKNLHNSSYSLKEIFKIKPDFKHYLNNFFSIFGNLPLSCDFQTPTTLRGFCEFWGRNREVAFNLKPHQLRALQLEAFRTTDEVEQHISAMQDDDPKHILFNNFIHGVAFTDSSINSSGGKLSGAVFNPNSESVIGTKDAMALAEYIGTEIIGGLKLSPELIKIKAQKALSIH